MSLASRKRQCPEIFTTKNTEEKKEPLMDADRMDLRDGELSLVTGTRDSRSSYHPFPAGEI
jgi:hypothetical protein